jgi:hypothetical protein
MPVPMDEFPLHQHPVSFARVGTSDRNFYDGTYFKGRGWVDGSSLDCNDPAVAGRVPYRLLDHVARARCDWDEGYGLFEHGLLGRYTPFGFADFFAVAP